MTDRRDNDTLRAILANPVGTAAVASGTTLPWSDGTVLAKLAWDKARAPEGSTHAGAFKQVEFMLKNARAYADTQGWQYSRSRGMELTPYGNDASFMTECTGCHAQQEADDFAFTKPRGRHVGPALGDLQQLWTEAPPEVTRAALVKAAKGPSNKAASMLSWPRSQANEWFGAWVPAGAPTASLRPFRSYGQTVAPWPAPLVAPGR